MKSNTLTILLTIIVSIEVHSDEEQTTTYPYMTVDPFYFDLGEKEFDLEDEEHATELLALSSSELQFMERSLENVRHMESTFGWEQNECIKRLQACFSLTNIDDQCSEL